MSSLPPDVADARKNRVNNEILGLFKRAPQKSEASSRSFRGMGFYTHVANSPSAENAAASLQPQFLPSGGPSQYNRKAMLSGELPEEIKAIHRDMAQILERERELISREIIPNPSDKYGEFVLPVAPLRLPRRICHGDLMTLRHFLLSNMGLNIVEFARLKKMLGESRWPPRLASVEAYNASTQKPWSDHNLNPLTVYNKKKPDNPGVENPMCKQLGFPTGATDTPRVITREQPVRGEDLRRAVLRKTIASGKPSYDSSRDPRRKGR
ncbi:unnamed protein product [Periconia digitata]|uniref:Uncharacterized protein n=1 Tax=Periconia digitata TaxID=1303443 RepID=A0A9W4XGM1_9PLEO|nr:unnamed protein product [Periconia digitata]